MRLTTLLTIAGAMSFAHATKFTPEPFALVRRQGGDSFIPGSTPVGSTCPSGSLECGARDCIIPSRGDSCCKEGCEKSQSPQSPLLFAKNGIQMAVQEAPFALPRATAAPTATTRKTVQPRTVYPFRLASILLPCQQALPRNLRPRRHLLPLRLPLHHQLLPLQHRHRPLQHPRRLPTQRPLRRRSFL